MDQPPQATGHKLHALTFTDEPLAEVIASLRACLEPLSSGEPLTFLALDPDAATGLHEGEFVERGGRRFRYRSLRGWLELADRLGCRLGTPKQVTESDGALLELTLSKLESGSWHQEKSEGSEAYGPGSPFSRVQKLEEPTFLLDVQEALARVQLGPGSEILSLGVGRGDELEPFAALPCAETFRFTGIDHSAGALESARQRFPGPNYGFIRADVNDLSFLEGRFDLALAVATLQSPGVDDRALLRDLVQNRLTPNGSVILALPNSRYEGGALRYGAKVKNLREPDLSLVVKDAAFYRKYLQQHRFRVFVTGRYYLFLTAVRSG